jgi:hypothetical protein
LLKQQAEFGEIAVQPVAGRVGAAGRLRALVGIVAAGVPRMRRPLRLDALLPGRIENGGIEPFPGGHAATTRGFARGLERPLSDRRKLGFHGRIRVSIPWSGSRAGLAKPTLV